MPDIGPGWVLYSVQCWALWRSLTRRPLARAMAGVTASQARAAGLRWARRGPAASWQKAPALATPGMTGPRSFLSHRRDRIEP